MTITFNELRNLKDSLPTGSMETIAKKLELSVETVRNYFGGCNYVKGQSLGVHYEQGPSGGVVFLEDTTIYDLAKELLERKEN